MAAWAVPAAISAYSAYQGSKGGGYQPPDPLGFRGGGLSAQFGQDMGRGGGGYTVTSTPERQGLVSGLQNTFTDQANYFRNLATSFKPGFGALTDKLTSANRGLTESALSSLENRRRAAIGNLQENLASRRVLGSSFGMDALSRSEAEWEKQKQDVMATSASREADIQYQSFLKEFDIFNTLNQQAYQSSMNGIMTALNEMNLQADIGAKMAGQASNIVQSNAQFAEQLKAQSALGWGMFSGQMAGLALKNYQPGTTPGTGTNINTWTPSSPNLGAGTTYGTS